VAYVGREEDARYVGVVGEEFADGNERGYVGALDHAPDVDVALESNLQSANQTISSLPLQPSLPQTKDRRNKGGKKGTSKLTALFPAQSILPSLATVTLATLTSSSGIN
jgi:hypothetical protein